MDINIRKMQKKDILKVHKIEQECFSKPWSKNALEYELKNKTAYFIVAESKDEILAYAGMHSVLTEGYIANIAVKAEHRNKGLAKKLIERLKVYGKENKFDFISLEVRKSNSAAINLYKSELFLEQGIRKNFYTSPVENALILTYFFNK